jgi:hypothetical protein
MRTPVLPDTAIDPTDDSLADMPAGDDLNDHLEAERDVSDGMEDISVQPFDDPRSGGPLNFDDGTDMGYPRGKTGRAGGTWNAEGSDSGDLEPPAELLSDRNGPSDKDNQRTG